MEYDKNKDYVFRDSEGNITFTSKGDNQYVQQSITQGIPIYVNEKGEWYTQPYLESTPTGVTVHMTDWFKNSDEYNQWQNIILPQIQTRTLDVDLFNQAQNILKTLGNQSLLRFTTYNQAEESGITDPILKKFVFDQYTAAINEGANKQAANLVAYGSTHGESAADLARSFKNMSKEKLSNTILRWENTLDKENTEKSQEEKANALATYKILNLIADNPADFGDGKEFEGLLEASEWQKFQAHITSVMQTLSEGLPGATWGARLGSGIASDLKGDFSEGWQIENRRNQRYGFLRSEATGGGLRGIEGSQVSGNVAGNVVNIAATMAQSAELGTFLNSKIASDSAGTALNAIGKFANTVVGGMVYDFFANDLPVDLSLFAVDLSRTGSAGEAWESQTGETQPLFGLFGPQVPAGLKYNLIGDAVLDLTMSVISIGSGAMYRKLDNITGGSVTKLRENVALKNLSVQQKFSDIPIIGTAGQKFSNWLFGAENASFIREMRKQAIIEKSLTPYTDAQNLLTLKNHYGAEVVAPYYQKLLKDYGINDQLKNFKKNANEYDGIGEVKVEWDRAKAGVSKHFTETVMDDLPRKVKAGLLDYQRLEELRGEKAIEGEGLVSNPKRDKQIVELERRVEALPDDIKKFAQDFSDLNKAVENMAVMLGIKSEDWLNALLEDPRWKNYMVRQVLLPGGSRGAGALDPAVNKIIFGRRTGYYNPDQTLSPVMALDMKVHALGNAYAWNERAKAIVGAEIAQGKISAGATSIEIAEKIKAKRAEIAAQESATAKLGYDAIAQGYSNRMFDLGSAAKKMNDELSSFEDLTVRSVYTQGETPSTKELVSDYESGKITWAEGVRENSGLSVQDGDSLIQNTYKTGTIDAPDLNLKRPEDARYTQMYRGQGTGTDNFYFNDPERKSSTVGNGYYMSTDRGVSSAFEGSGGKGGGIIEPYIQNKYIASEDEVRNTFKIAEETVSDQTKYNKLKNANPELAELYDQVASGQYEAVSKILEKPVVPYLDATAGADEFLYYKGVAKDLDNEFVIQLSSEYDYQKALYTNYEIEGKTPKEIFDGNEQWASLSFEEKMDLLDQLDDKMVDQIDTALDMLDAKFDNASADLSKPATNNFYAGITSDGVPYEYTIEGNKITSVAKITSDEGLAESLTGVNQYWKTTPETARRLGEQNVAAMNRAAMFYRDNLPTIKVENNIAFDPTIEKGAYGAVLSNPRLSFNEDNTLNIHFESRVNPYYYLKGNEEKTLKAMKGDTEIEEIRLLGRKRRAKGSWHPKNSDDLAQTFIHESMHTVMQQLTQLEENIKIKEGTRLYHYTSREDFYDAKLDMEDRVLMAAAGRIGEIFNDDLRLSISVYAAYPKEVANRNAETIAEAFVDYAFNGAEAAPFSQAIVQEVSSRLQKHSMAVNPKKTLQENNLNAPKGLLKGDDYAFPASVKTQTQKAEWLDGWRKKNPYLKKEFTDENFRKANLWDSYFQKEITSFDPNYKTSAPENLLSKSGDFVEARRAEIAKSMTDTIKRLSGGEFDSDLAMIMMGRNGKDIAEAMENYIIRQIDISAEDLAKNLDGGLTPDNLNTARITLWSDENLKASTIEMLNNLVPGGTLEVDSMVDILFKRQADGLAAYDKLTTDAKELIAEKDELVRQLYKENEKTMKLGKKMDKNSSYIDGGTHLIHYRDGGEEVYVAVSDPVVATMLEKPYDYKELGLVGESIVQISNFLATTYRLGTTGVNPMSFIRNVLRDPIQATVTAGFNPLSMTLSPEVFYRSLRQYGLDNDTILEVTNRIRNWATSSTLTQEMRIGTSRSSATYRNNVEKVSKQLNSVTNGKIITTLSAPLETWEGFFRNQVGQQSFVRNLGRTGDVDKALSSALFDTSNATTNFSHAIGKFKRATGTIPYLSSAINGTVSFARLFNIDPVGMVTRITAGFMVPVMAITAWNLGNEDNRRAYETLPEWFKQSHLVMTDGSGNIIAFPLPEEIQQFAGTARKLIEFTNEVSPYSLATIAAQGAFGFLPFDVDGFWGDDGSFQLKKGAFQMASGLIPQAATTLYELWWQQDLFTGEDLSTYDGLNTAINTLSNIFGTGIKQVANSLGIMAGVSEKDIIGKSFQDTIARDLFGMGFDAAKTQFMNIVGSPAKLKEDGTMSTSTGLFKENEELKKKVDALSAKIAVASDSEKAGLEEQKQKLIDDFTNRVVNLMNNYQRMFQLTGGLEAWQKNRLVQVLTLGDAWSSGSSESYQAEAASEAYLNERGLAQQRYVQAGLPAGPDLENLVGNNSIELQAAINAFYGGPKQAATDYRNAVKESGLKDIRNEFYNVMQQIYDAAEEQGLKPDYDLIEKIQARYLQAVDAVLVPIINQYGINILNNSDFIDAVRKQVNGMIPSDDWRQSVRNAKKFLSSKDFPTTTVDVKKWLTQRYSSGMRNRNIASDPEVTQRLEEIRVDIDAGRGGAAKGKIQALMSGIQKANYYISSDDFMTLTQYNNMLK